MKYLFLLFSVLPVQTCHHIDKDPPTTLNYYQLKLRLVDSLGEVNYCDRDFFPVVRPAVEQNSAQHFFDTLKPNSEELRAITEHLGITGKTNFTNDEKLAVYRQHKALLAITLDTLPVKYTFQIDVKSTDGGQWRYQGQISPSGQISITTKKPFKINCPICLPYYALIETPKGAVEVKDLKTGDSVITVDASGNHFATTILTIGKSPVPPSHKMIHIKLNDGREFTASFGHPLADRRVLSQIKRFDMVQKSRVIELDTVNYTGGYTYDILPNGATGFYLVNGILVGSTLKIPL